VNDLFSDLGSAYSGGAAASIATAINGNHEVVGIYHDTGSGTWKSFGATAGVTGDQPNDISKSGSVVGVRKVTQRALWFSNTELTGDTWGNASAVSVNNNGQVVGTNTKKDGFYYAGRHGTVAINDVVPTADRRAYVPAKINDKGS
jgi:hypothetical protein